MIIYLPTGIEKVLGFFWNNLLSIVSRNVSVDTTRCAKKSGMWISGLWQLGMQWINLSFVGSLNCACLTTEGFSQELNIFSKQKFQELYCFPLLNIFQSLSVLWYLCWFSGFNVTVHWFQYFLVVTATLRRYSIPPVTVPGFLEFSPKYCLFVVYVLGEIQSRSKAFRVPCCLYRIF